MTTQFLTAVPIVPAPDVESITAWYHDRLGFDVFLAERDYGIVGRGEAWIHFNRSAGQGAEDSASTIRIGVAGIDELYEHCRAEGIVHPREPLKLMEWGFREFSIADGDGRLVTFFEPPDGYDPRADA